MKVIVGYLLIINIIALLSYGVDKAKAKYHRWRISEKTLILLAIIGGSIGAILGMLIFHHKTTKALFKYGIPLIIVIQILIIIYIIKDMNLCSCLINSYFNINSYI